MAGVAWFDLPRLGGSRAPVAGKRWWRRYSPGLPVFAAAVVGIALSAAAEPIATGALAARICAAAAEPYVIGHNVVRVSASIGISL